MNFCPLCEDPHGAHLIGTGHTYGPECRDSLAVRLREAIHNTLEAMR